MSTPPIRVMVADDNPDLADVLAYVIGIEPAMECVGCVHSADHLAEKIRALRPDVLVLDAKMPGGDPLAVVTELGPEFPGVRTIFYSGFDDPDFIEQIIDAGAWGFVSKRQQAPTVIEAIRSVAAGRVVFPERRPPSPQADSAQP
jgi:DNA-binding NarL/FixJ family response regulator